jgi:hypothetical protein
MFLSHCAGGYGRRRAFSCSNSISNDFSTSSSLGSVGNTADFSSSSKLGGISAVDLSSSSSSTFGGIDGVPAPETPTLAYS